MTKIGRPKTMASRKQVSLTPELEAAVEEFRFAHRHKTESDALRRLIEVGLGAEPYLRSLLKLLEREPPIDADEKAMLAKLRQLLGLPDQEG